MQPHVVIEFASADFQKAKKSASMVFFCEGISLLFLLSFIQYWRHRAPQLENSLLDCGVK